MQNDRLACTLRTYDSEVLIQLCIEFHAVCELLKEEETQGHVGCWHEEGAELWVVAKFELVLQLLLNYLPVKLLDIKEDLKYRWNSA